jgi:copper chaperone
MAVRLCRSIAVSTLLLIAGALPIQGCKPASPAQQPTYAVTFDVQGMHCEGCVNAITDKVMKVKGVKSCTVSLDEHSASVVATSPGQEAAIEAAITRLGYTVTRK